MTRRGDKFDRRPQDPGNDTLIYNWDEIPDDLLSQIPDELFSQVPSLDQHTRMSKSQFSCGVEHGLNEEENCVIEEEEGMYDNFVQNEGEDDQLQQNPRFEHGSESDDSDYELYDEENDVAIEDDHLFDDTAIHVLTPLGRPNGEDDDTLSLNLSQENTVLEDEYTMESGSLLPLNFMQDNIVQEREYDSDDLNSPVNSDDEEEGMIKYPEFNAATDMENPIFVIGMLFATKNDVKEAIKEYSIKGGYETTIKKNDKTRMTAKCIPGCPWKIHASPNEEGTWQIKSLVNVHNCSRQYKNKHVTYKYIAKKWLDRFRDDPKLSLKTLKSTVRREIEVDVSHGQCTRGRQEAIKMIEGSYKEQYSRIWEYCAEVRQTNKNNSMFVRANPPYFQRLFVCLEACKNGFKKGCRPIIGVDGCHLKGAFGGQLLAAVGIDANDNMYPIAYAVVESEDKETWCWFLQLLIEDLGPVEMYGWNFVSDQQKGLDEAFKIVVPTANHRWCVRHLYGNFKKLHKGKALKDLLWSAARAPNNAEFETEMIKLKKLSKPAYNWLVGKDPRRWARSRFTSRLKCDMLLNNLCETFNSWILAARDQPILTMLEMIRCNLMRRYQVKRQQIVEFQNAVCPKIQNKLNKAIHASRYYIPTYSGNFEFQVGETIKDRHVVNLRERTCSCRRWDLTGIPCLHAVACIHHNREKPEAYVDKYYHKETYLKAYEPMIHPIKGYDMWPKCNQEPLMPPLVKKQPGRPKKVRRKDPEMEKDPNNPMQVVSRKGKTITCTKCYGKGHNRRSCKNQPVDVPPNVYVDKRYAYPRPASVGEKRGEQSDENLEQCSGQSNKTRKTTSASPTSWPNIQPTENSNMPSANTNSWQGLYCNPHETSYVQVPHQPTITRASRGGTFTRIPRHNNSSMTSNISTSRVNISKQKVGTSAPKFGTSTTTTQKKSSKNSTRQGSTSIWRPPEMTHRQKN